MANDKLINLISKLTDVFLSAPKKEQKPAYKPENAKNTPNGRPSFGGDFSSKAQNVISPKQSVVEMLRRHEELSKKISEREKKEDFPQN